MSHDCDAAASGFEPLMFTTGALSSSVARQNKDPLKDFLLKDQHKDSSYKDQDFLLLLLLLLLLLSHISTNKVHTAEQK